MYIDLQILKYQITPTCRKKKRKLSLMHFILHILLFSLYFSARSLTLILAKKFPVIQEPQLFPSFVSQRAAIFYQNTCTRNLWLHLTGVGCKCEFGIVKTRILSVDTCSFEILSICVVPSINLSASVLFCAYFCQSSWVLKYFVCCCMLVFVWVESKYCFVPRLAFFSQALVISTCTIFFIEYFRPVPKAF